MWCWTVGDTRCMSMYVHGAWSRQSVLFNMPHDGHVANHHLRLYQQQRSATQNLKQQHFFFLRSRLRSLLTVIFLCDMVQVTSCHHVPPNQWQHPVKKRCSLSRTGRLSQKSGALFLFCAMPPNSFFAPLDRPMLGNVAKKQQTFPSVPFFSGRTPTNQCPRVHLPNTWAAAPR